MLITDADIRDVEVRNHTLRGKAEFSEPTTGAWRPLFVVSGTVTLNAPGVLPGRTCEVVGLTTGADGLDVFPDLSIFGSWVRLTHEVFKLNGDKVSVPLGHYRVERLVVDSLAGSVTISGQDAGAFVQDYELVTLAQGEVLAGVQFRNGASDMLTAAMGGIVPWWTTLVDLNGAPATTVPSRLQFDRESRTEAVGALLSPIGREVRVAIDGVKVFIFHVPATAASPPVVEIHPGELGNLDEMQSTIDRTGIANVATVSYTVAGEQKRLVSEYTADPKIAAGGPFGRVSVEGQAPSADTDASALERANIALASSTTLVRDISINCSPVYGIESGDPVKVRGRDPLKQAATRVVGGRIPLTAMEGWSLTLRCYDPYVDVERRIA